MKLVFGKVASSKWSLGLFGALALGLATLFGEDIRHEFNEVANRGTKLEQRDLITWKGPHKYGTIISARSIAETGNVGVYAPLSPGNLRVGNKYADWNADDAFARAVRSVGDDVAASVAKSDALRALMQKDVWTAEDCRLWDGTVTTMIASALDRVPGLQSYQYRADEDPGWFRALVTGEERGMRATRNLNDLSADIENRTYQKEYDCEGMSIVLVYLLQRTADRMLSPAQAPSYSYVAGSGSANSEEGSGVHAFILSRQGPDIVSIIEGTEYTLRTPAEGVFPLERFAAGEMLLCEEGAVYGLDFTTEDIVRLCVSKGLPLHGERLQHAIGKNAPPQGETPQLEVPVIAAPPPDLVTMALRR